MKTKIIATIGPASLEFDTLKKMVEAGLSIGRINTKYGSPEQYKIITTNLRDLGVEIMFDVKGPDALEWLKQEKFDYLAVSFAETPSQIKEIRDQFKNNPVKIIAKIETAKGMDELDNLIDASDGVMVARGDLGKNTSLEEVPVFQKIIIRKCNEKNKMVITATEMLLSMTSSLTPERAEVSDVANAVLDGTDYVMLSEETSIGEHPVEAVEEMRKIIEETEKQKDILK